jgi:hypothetical protein
MAWVAVLQVFVYGRMLPMMLVLMHCTCAPSDVLHWYVQALILGFVAAPHQPLSIRGRLQRQLVVSQVIIHVIAQHDFWVLSSCGLYWGVHV